MGQCDTMENSSGKLGESFVKEYLIRHGFCILEQNYHSRFGEIDIIAENKEYIVFVEVKTRKQGSTEHPFEAITRAKQKKILVTAQAYLSKVQSSLQPRFDAAAVTTQNGRVIHLEYLENCFP